MLAAFQTSAEYIPACLYLHAGLPEAYLIRLSKVRMWFKEMTAHREAGVPSGFFHLMVRRSRRAPFAASSLPGLPATTAGAPSSSAPACNDTGWLSSEFYSGPHYDRQLLLANLATPVRGHPFRLPVQCCAYVQIA